jgi:hypothetical protein
MGGMFESAPKDPLFEELVEAFEDPDHPGWSVGSAEGGWVTPSEDEWGKPAPSEDTLLEQAQGAG